MSPEYGTMTVNSNPVAHRTTIEFTVGETIHLHAEPLDSGYLFKQWRNNGGIVFANPSSQDQDVVIPDGTTQIRFTADFIENTHYWTVSAFVVPSSAGEISLPVREVQDGLSTTFEVNPLDGSHYTFIGWALSDNPADPIVCVGPSYQITDIHENKTVYAHYSYVNQLLTVTAAASPSDGGTATVSYWSYVDQTSISDIPENHDFTLKATPSNGYTFVGWKKNDNPEIVSQSATWVTQLPSFSSDTTFTAVFTQA